MKTKNPWIMHLQKFKKDHPKMSLTDAMKKAKSSYKKK